MPDDQGEVTSGLGSRGQPLALLFQLSDAGPQVGHARFELSALDEAVGISIDQPPDPAPQGTNAALDISDICIRRLVHRQLHQASPVLVSNPPRII